MVCLCLIFIKPHHVTGEPPRGEGARPMRAVATVSLERNAQGHLRMPRMGVESGSTLRRTR
ncbi:hypothetical protein LP414_32445 [Polaromonas sp. P1(28)-13]|nr:hypothetical protein LP414_32445 [Polaromonas sp. P1(28)-13]